MVIASAMPWWQLERCNQTVSVFHEPNHVRWLLAAQSSGVLSAKEMRQRSAGGRFTHPWQLPGRFA
jgi:hypothetical protein